MFKRLRLIQAAMLATILLPATRSLAQSGSEDLSDLLDDKAVKTYTRGAFKTGHIVNSHSIENTAKGSLDFRISHRFGPLNSGIKDFFGMDAATLRLGLDYGINDRITVGIGRSSYFKEYDGFVKAKILQQTDKNEMPLSMSYVGGMSITTLRAGDLLGRQLTPFEKFPMSNRLFFFNQLLLARKFDNRFTLQLMPTHVHYNLVNTKSESNDLFSLGAGGRVRLSKRITFNVEYYYQFNQLLGTTNSLGAGFDIETGGHVFQLFCSNSIGINERTFIAQTTEKWQKGGIHFGFNISRIFTVVKPKGFENSRNKIW
jgi:opacity protein-like surface antigen